MGVSKVGWLIGAIKYELGSTYPVRPILIEHGGMKRRSRVDIIKLGKPYAVRLKEGVGSSRSTTTIPAESLSEALASVRYIMEGARVNVDGDVVGKFAGKMSVLLEGENPFN